MSNWTADDIAFMAEALTLAKRGIYTTAPNPSVGCVLVKNGQIVGKGFHLQAGMPHAEIMALGEAGKQAKGASVYVTLEPCSHFGRTPPCADALIRAGVKRVVVAMADPNPLVGGKGIERLRQAGISTEVGLKEAEAYALNQAFFHRMKTGRPWVQLKMAMSLDGRSAMATGESKWISNATSRADVQRLRGKAGAILSTSRTVLQDDPRLNLRWDDLPSDMQAHYPLAYLRQPVRVVLDNHHKVLPTAQLFQTNAPVWLVSHQARNLSDFPAYCEEMIIPNAEMTDLAFLLNELGKRQINSLWLEAGARFAGAMIEQNLVDELILYIAPLLLGDNARGLCHLPHLHKLADASKWRLMENTELAGDVKLVYHPRK